MAKWDHDDLRDKSDEYFAKHVSGDPDHRYAKQVKTHNVKSWSHFFDAIVAGNKTHDLRKMDRDFRIGDHVILERYDNINGVYTGEKATVEVTYITSEKTPCAFSSSVLDKGYCILSIKLI